MRYAPAARKWCSSPSVGLGLTISYALKVNATD
jgi:hypothetical protein